MKDQFINIVVMEEIIDGKLDVTFTLWQNPHHAKTYLDEIGEILFTKEKVLAIWHQKKGVHHSVEYRSGNQSSVYMRRKILNKVNHRLFDNLSTEEFYTHQINS